MKVCIIPNRGYSHMLPLRRMIISLLQKNKIEKIGICLFKKDVSLELKEIERLNQERIEFIYISEFVHEKNKEIAKDYSFYNGNNTELINNTNLIKKMHLDLVEFNLKISDTFFLDLKDRVSDFKPDVIIRDSCAIYGKKIADYIKSKCLSYTTMFGFSEEQLVNNAEFGLKLLLGELANRIPKNDRGILYKELSLEVRHLLDLYGYRIPVNYMNDGGEEKNLIFAPRWNISSGIKESESKKYKYCRPLSFKNIESVFEKKKRLLIVCGENDMFPRWVYEDGINKLSNKYEEVFVGFKLYNHPNIKLNHIPSNVKISRWIDQQKLLKESKLFITHGGFNSMMESIDNLVPMIVVPTHHDQYINSIFVEMNRLGKSLPYKKEDDSELEEAEKKIMEDYPLENLRKIKTKINDLPELEMGMEWLLQNEEI